MAKPVYPRGFVAISSGVPSVNDVFHRHDGDEEVIELYTAHVKKLENTETWEFRKKVIDCAVRLFGDFPTWVNCQLNNRYLHGTNISFLGDTIRFIDSGKRDIKVLTWMGIMEEKPDPIRLSERADLDPIVHDYAVSGPKTDVVLSKWCGRENGFEDLLCSLYCMFGE